MEDKTRKTLKNVLFGSLITLASFLPINKANAQTEKINNPNTLHFTFQPGELGTGFRNDYRIPSGRKKDNEPSKFGVYCSASVGDCRLTYDQGIKGYFRINHLKTGGGGIFYFGEEDSKNLSGFINLGASYNNYTEKPYFYELGNDIKGENDRRFRKLSLDLGVGGRINNFSGFVSMDILNPELTFGVNIFELLSKN